MMLSLFYWNPLGYADYQGSWADEGCSVRGQIWWIRGKFSVFVHIICISPVDLSCVTVVVATNAIMVHILVLQIVREVDRMNIVASGGEAGVEEVNSVELFVSFAFPPVDLSCLAIAVAINAWVWIPPFLFSGNKGRSNIEGQWCPIHRVYTSCITR